MIRLRQSRYWPLVVLLSVCLVLAFISPASGQEENAATQILENQESISLSMDAAITAAMNDLVKTEGFKQACNIGAFLVIFGFAPVVMSVVKMYHADMTIDRDSFLHKGLVVIIILLLFGTPINRGRLLGETLIGVNSINNWASNSILVATAGETGNQAIAEQIQKEQMESIVRAEQQECAKIPEVNGRESCFLEINEIIDHLIVGFDSAAWAINTGAIMHSMVSRSIEFALDYGSSDFVAEVLSFGNRVVEETIKAFCYGLGQAFVIGLEHIKLIMILIAPICLGLELVPLFNGFFGTWLKNFCLIELCQLLYNVVLSLVAYTMIGVNGVSPIVFPLIVAVFSIVIALTLTAGGGISIFTQVAATAAKGAAMVGGAARR